MPSKTQWIQQFADPHTGQNRDCIHGNLARSCNICEMEHEIFDLKLKLNEALAKTSLEGYRALGQQVADALDQRDESLAQLAKHPIQGEYLDCLAGKLTSFNAICGYVSQLETKLAEAMKLVGLVHIGLEQIRKNNQCGYAGDGKILAELRTAIDAAMKPQQSNQGE